MSHIDTRWIIRAYATGDGRVALNIMDASDADDIDTVASIVLTAAETTTLADGLVKVANLALLVSAEIEPGSKPN